MTPQETLTAIADVASVATAAVAVLAHGGYLISTYSNRKRVEDLLWRAVTNPPLSDPRPERSIEELVAWLNMSERDVLRAVRNNKHIRLRVEGPADR